VRSSPPLVHSSILTPDSSPASADRALAQELCYGVVRWQAALDWLIARKTAGRTQKGVLQILLRLGLYQLFWLDRIPDHAAVNETVQLARELGFGPQAGFVNALLRGCLRERDALEQALQDLKLRQPHLGYSHPQWLCDRWQQRWGAEKTRALLDWNNAPPPVFIRVNTLKTTPEKLARQFEQEGVLFTPRSFDWMQSRTGVSPAHERVSASPASAGPPRAGETPALLSPPELVIELRSHPPLASLTSFQQGWFYVQDPSTLLAVRELDPQPGDTVLDLCAAPGGKTTFIAQLMQNRGVVLAQDADSARLKLLRENCDRLGATCVNIPQGAGLTTTETTGRFDRILVDAPCSNTGVMRRRVDLRWRIQPAEIARLRSVQLDLLRQAATRLQPGGTLVYSTCSLEPEENNHVVAEFLSIDKSFRLAVERQMIPFADGADGAYVAKLLGG
jgi:16S rRNA (cytosine967-C5)-methyltransferase